MIQFQIDPAFPITSRDQVKITDFLEVFQSLSNKTNLSGYCLPVSCSAAKLFPQHRMLGGAKWSVVSGDFWGPGEAPIGHYWLESGNEWLLDLTYGQFFPGNTAMVWLGKVPDARFRPKDLQDDEVDCTVAAGWIDPCNAALNKTP